MLKDLLPDCAASRSAIWSQRQEQQQQQRVATAAIHNRAEMTLYLHLTVRRGRPCAGVEWGGTVRRRCQEEAGLRQEPLPVLLAGVVPIPEEKFLNVVKN